MDAMRVASTPQGAAAVKGNPMLAAMLQKSMEEPKKKETRLNPKDFTPESWKQYAASNYKDDTLLRSWETTLTPQHRAEIGLKTGQFTFETGMTPPIYPAPSPTGAAPTTTAPSPTQTAAPQVQPSAAPAPQAQPQTITGAPTRREALAGALEKTEEKPKSAFEMATPQQRLKLQQELPQARAAAQVGLTKLDQLDDYLADLEKHAGTKNITGLFGQIPIDIAPESRSARKTLESFQQGASIQAINEARQASTTGGAYGNMTVQEWPRLENVFGAVVAAKDPEAFDVAIKNARAQIEAARNRYISSWNGVYGDMPIGYKRPKYTPESSLYPREKGKGKTGRSSVRDEADAIIRGD